MITTCPQTKCVHACVRLICKINAKPFDESAVAISSASFFPHLYSRLLYVQKEEMRKREIKKNFACSTKGMEMKRQIQR